MQLVFTPPDSLLNATQNAVYCLPFDIGQNGKPCEGWLTVFIDKIVTYENGIVQFQQSLLDIKDFKTEAGIGCGLLACEVKETPTVICHFSKKLLPRMCDLVNAVESYFDTGIFDAGSNEDEKNCPKCGKPFFEGMNSCFFCTKKTFLLKRLFTLTKPFNRAILISALFLIASNIFQVINPIIFRKIIDGYVTPKNHNYHGLFLLFGLTFACYVGMTVTNIISSRMNNRTSNDLENDLRNQVYQKIQSLSLSSLSKRTSGELMKRISNDTSVIRNFIGDNARWVIELSVIFIGITSIMLFSNWKLTLLVFIPVPIIIFLVSKIWKRVHIIFEKQWIQGSRVNSILHDIIGGIRVVKSFGNEEREIAKYRNASKILAEISANNEKFCSTVFPMLGFLMGIGEFFILYFGGEAILGQRMQLGELIQFTSYVAMLYGPLQWVTFIPRSFAEAITSTAKLFEILDEEPEIADKPESVCKDIQGQINFQNVSFGYKSYEPILKNIDLTIQKGEMVGIVGHSGAGKSTLINLIMRNYDVNRGCISIDQTDIRDITVESLRSHIGVVLQETFLFSGTIYDNIRYAKQNASPEEIFTAARIANAHDFIIKMPDAYNTIIGERGYTLSGGERQRIAIARAILHNPSILILDEATASLDTETEKLIQDALEKLIKGRTTIAIAHRLSTLRNANRLIVLDKGKLVEAGTHEELLQNKGTYYNLVMAQRQTNQMKKNTEAQAV